MKVNVWLVCIAIGNVNMYAYGIQPKLDVECIVNVFSSRALAALGLVIIALGTGGIKPCVSAFGGDQFKEGQVWCWIMCTSDRVYCNGINFVNNYLSPSLNLYEMSHE